MSGTPALLGALGLVGLGFGLLSFLLALFGAPTDPWWIGANLVVGVVLLGAAAALGLDSLRERMRSGEARRAGKYGSSAIASTLLAIAIVGLLGFFSTRYSKRWDLSEQGIHSLSEQTLKLLKGLDQDVAVTVLFPATEADAPRELLDRYRYESSRFDVEYADPTERPDLLERYAIEPGKVERGVVRVALGEESTLVDEVTEENVTNALLKLTRTGSKKVYFLTGHGERAVEKEDAQSKEGLSGALSALANENYQTAPLLLASTGEVPADADVVVIAGPTRPLLPEEHVALAKYLGSGGALLLMIDPRAKTDLYDDLRGFGVELGDDVVIDRSLALFGRMTTPFAASYATDHPITEGLQEPAMFHMVRSVKATGAPGSQFTNLVMTGDASWAERDLGRFEQEGVVGVDAEDQQGPVTIAVAGKPSAAPAAAPAAADAEKPAAAAADATDAAAPEAGKPEGDAAKPAREPRLVVFGDSDFASNQMLEAYRNRDLFLNSVNWLLGDVEAISIRPVRARASRFQLSAEQYQQIRTLALFLLPEGIAVAGVLTWFRRRNPPAQA
jgi:ABC-type uncharacterized transport system involved in gliding motility auxiliary subunit